jgi:hypothetical protein
MSGSLSPTTYIVVRDQVSTTGQIMEDNADNLTHFAWTEEYQNGF